jgi:flagellar basal-body rod modification protein FlgD
MAVGNVQNTSTLMQAATAANASKTPTSGQLDKDAFMKLLIAQLKNQDPSSPADPKDFITQLSTLTSVEKMTNMADQLSSLQTATSSMVANQASDLVGKNIEGDGSKLYLGQMGGASTSFSLGANASKVTVTVRDAAGQEVHKEVLGNTAVGAHTYTWDGQNDQGVHAGTGQFTVSIDALDANGKAVDSTTKITGTVTKVSYERGFPELYVGSAAVALANVKSISN